MTTTIYNNYWLADDGRVFGSAKQAIIDPNDPDYVAWSAYKMPTPWPRDLGGNQTDAALQDVLTPYNLFIDLAAYAANARYLRASGGIVITSIAGDKVFASDPISRNAMNNAHDYTQVNAGATVQWKLTDGSFVMVDAANAATMMNAAAGFVQSCFNCESDMVSGIGAGTITTKAEIDAAFRAISNVFP